MLLLALIVCRVLEHAHQTPVELTLPVQSVAQVSAKFLVVGQTSWSSIVLGSDFTSRAWRHIFGHLVHWKQCIRRIMVCLVKLLRMSCGRSEVALIWLLAWPATCIKCTCERQRQLYYTTPTINCNLRLHLLSNKKSFNYQTLRYCQVDRLDGPNGYGSRPQGSWRHGHGRGSVLNECKL